MADQAVLKQSVMNLRTGARASIEEWSCEDKFVLVCQTKSPTMEILFSHLGKTKHRILILFSGNPIEADIQIRRFDCYHHTCLMADDGVMKILREELKVACFPAIFRLEQQHFTPCSLFEIF